MPTVVAKVSLDVHYVIQKEAGVYWGYIKEYPGIIDQGRTRDSVKKKLENDLRWVVKTMPDDLGDFAEWDEEPNGTSENY